MMKKFFFLLFVICSTMSLAQGKYSPSAQQLLNKQTSNVQRMKADGEEHYIHTTLQVSDAKVLEQYGIIVGTQVGDLATALVPVAMYDRLGEIPEISFIDAGQTSHLLLDVALPYIGYDQLLSSIYTPEPYLGKGVIVGIVDLGFQWDHAAFRNADGSTRIIAAWNQNDKSGTPPEPYSYGSLYDTEEEILNGQTEAVETHATHVTGIAAGSSYPDMPYGGVAREASLVLVEAQHAGGSSMYDEGITDGINFIFDYADRLGMPCVINLSIGNVLGPHDGTSAFDQMCDSLQGPGRLIVGAMGNSGSEYYHLGYDFDEEHTEFHTGLTGVPIIDAWSEEPVYIDLEFYHGHTDTILDATGWMPLDSLYETTLNYFQREITVTATSQLSPFNNKYNTQIVVSGINNIGNCYFAMKVKGEKGRLDMWTNAPATVFTTHGFDGWLHGDTLMTLNETGGTGKRITSVGAYTTDDSKLCIRGNNYTTGYEINAVSPFSSLGHTADGRIKPDIIAPGSLITSAYNKMLIGNMFGMTTNEFVFHNDTTYYGLSSGTSMAAPIVTGTYAIWLQAKPDMTPEEAKEILKLTAIKDEYTTHTESAGHGKVNLYGGLCHIFDSSNITSPALDTNIQLYPTIGDGDFTLYYNESEYPTQLRIYNATGMLIGTYNIEKHPANTPMQMTIPYGYKGIHYIQVTTNKGQYTHKYVSR